MESRELRNLVLAALMAALMAAGAYIAIPVGPVPIVLQNLFVLLAGLLLGPGWGLASVLVYLFLGAVGLPVLAGGAGGVSHFAGPTGGYLLGYVPAVVVTGVIARAGRSSAADAAAAVAGTLVVYAAGVPFLALVTHMSASRALAVGLLPFLIGDALKVVLAVAVARWARPVMASQAP